MSPNVPPNIKSNRLSAEATLDLLRAFESRNVTCIASDGSWPIVWQRARGMHVWDAEGKRYLDLTGAFGVAAAGHANPRVVRAGQRQMGRLLHAMGDVHPHPLKAALARRLSEITFERWSGLERNAPGVGSGQAESSGTRASVRTRLPRSAFADAVREDRGMSARRGKTIFCNSGFEAVEAALKTALLATGKPGVIAFEGAYHGLGYGALNATHRDHFRSPFRRQLREFATFAPFPPMAAELPVAERAVRRILRRGRTGAILVEPIQVRGGVNIPPPGFLPLLRRLCDEHGALLVLDEIYTGFGRTGAWFACEHAAGGAAGAGTVPDLVCLGKALTGGFPLSACVGRAEVMDAAWPVSDGEAIHTSTFLGHPVGCAMALAEIDQIERRGLVRQSAVRGRFLLDLLERLADEAAIPGLVMKARGRGLLAGLELLDRRGRATTGICLEVIKRMLHRGFILLPEGAEASVVSFTPPLIISERQIAATIGTLAESLRQAARAVA